jgi:hypothetical protein
LISIICVRRQKVKQQNWYFIYLKELKTQNHVKDLTVLILLENTYKL